MARKFLTSIDLNQNEIQNAVVQNLGSDPGSPVEGQFWTNTTLDLFSFWDGAQVIRLYPSASTNTASTLVLRDGSGNFAANTGTFVSVTISGSPSAGTDAATVAYVQSVAQGLQPKGSARFATTAPLPANTYANGTLGVGATLTATSFGALTVDGGTVLNGDDILVKDEVASEHNGLYTQTTLGTGGVHYVLTRKANMDQAAEIPGAYVFIGPDGVTNQETGWIVTSGAGPYVMGTDPITFGEFKGVGTLSFTAPLNLSANVVTLSYNARLVNNAGSLDLAASIVTPGTYGQVTVDTYGRVTAGATNDVSHGGTGATSAAAFCVICGGTTGTGAYQSVGVTGSSGQVLTSQGPGALPVWQTPGTGNVNKYSTTIGNASATSFTILQATHGLAVNGQMIVALYDASTGAEVISDVSINNANGTITLSFATAPASNAIRVVVLG